MARSKFDEAEDLAKNISKLVRDRALRAVFQHDEQLKAVYDRMAAGIRADLRATGFTVEQVSKILRKHFDATVDERVKIVGDAIIQSAREARVLPQETFDAIFGKEPAAAEAARPFGQRSPATAKHLPRLVRASAAKRRSTD